MSESKIARVYATALYQAADEEGRVEQVRRDLGEFVQAVEASAELRQLLVTEEISDAKKKEVLLELTEGGDELVRNLLRLLVDKSRESEVAGIYRAFVELVEQAQGLVHVEVVTAVPLAARAAGGAAGQDRVVARQDGRADAECRQGDPRWAPAADRRQGRRCQRASPAGAPPRIVDQPCG